MTVLPGRGRCAGITGIGFMGSALAAAIRVAGASVSVVAGRTRTLSTTEGRRYPPLPAGHPQKYRDAIIACVGDAHAAIRSDAPDGRPTLHDGVRGARITDVVLRSGWTDIADKFATSALVLEGHH